MAFPHPPGLLPAEVAFLCEMELVTIVPRQRLDNLDLLGGPTKALIPPARSQLPLWLAIMLKRQKRVNIMPPAWLNADSLAEILEIETNHLQDAFSPALALPSSSSSSSKLTDANGVAFHVSTPFIAGSTDTSANTTHHAHSYANANANANAANRNAETASGALPYHWFEMAEMLLDAASDDLAAAAATTFTSSSSSTDELRRLLRDLREVRLAKMRKGIDVLSGDGEGVRLNGVGAMELSESRGFITSVMDSLRKIGASREQARREQDEEERRNRGQYGQDDDEDDEDMT